MHKYTHEWPFSMQQDMGLYLDEDTLLIKPDAHDGMDAHEEEGIDETGEITIGDDAMDESEDARLDAKSSKHDAECLAHYIEEQWVHAEGKPKLGKPRVLGGCLACRIGTCLSLVDELNQQAENPCGESTSDENEARAPDSFVDAKPDKG